MFAAGGYSGARKPATLPRFSRYGAALRRRKGLVDGGSVLSEGDALAARVDAWLAPVSEASPCGPDLEHDAEYREFEKALAGKPETQFSELVPPDFRDAQARAEALFARTRDLRVAVGWSRATLRLDGIGALPSGLRLIHGLLQAFPAELNPVADPDDGSLYARANALAELREPSGLLGDLRQTVLLSDRALGVVRMRSIEIANGTLTAREDEASMSRDQLQQFFASAEGAPAVRSSLEDGRTRLLALGSFLKEQLGAMDAPDLAPVVAMLSSALAMMPKDEAAADAGEETGAVDGAAGQSGNAGRRAMPGNVNSRADAVRAIDMICEYLERSEPTNPAPLFLRRAKRLIDRNFLQLMKELAPDALAEVSKIMGVDPESVTTPSDSA